MGLRFDTLKLKTFRGTRPVSDVIQELERAGETVTRQAYWRWEQQGTEPRARTLLALAQILSDGDEELIEAAKVLQRAFFSPDTN